MNSKVEKFFVVNKSDLTAKCNICSQKLIIQGNGPKSNLWNHVKDNHSNWIDSFKSIDLPEIKKEVDKLNQKIVSKLDSKMKKNLNKKNKMKASKKEQDKRENFDTDYDSDEFDQTSPLSGKVHVF